MADVEPTKDEIKAGFSKESLNDYLAERERAAALKVFPMKRQLPRSQQPYSPLRWRR